MAGVLDDVEEGPELQRVLHVEQAVGRTFGEAGHQARLIRRHAVGGGDERWIELAHTHQRGPPVVHRLGHDIVDGQLPAELRRRVANAARDRDGVIDAAREQRDLVVRPCPLAGPLELVQEVDQARAVVVLGRVVLEDVPVAVHVVAHRELVAVLRIIVDVGDARVRDRVVFSPHRRRIVAVDDGVHGLAVDQAARRRGHRLRRDALGILEMELDGPTQDAARRVDFLDRERQADFEVARVVRAPTRIGQHGAQGDRIARRLGAVVERGQRTGAGNAHGADRHGPGRRHEAAPRRIERVEPAGLFHLLVIYI